MSAVRAAMGNSVAAVLLTALVAFFLVHTVLPAASRLSNGFLAYYVGALIIKNGEPAANLYDDERFSGRVKQVSGGQITGHFPRESADHCRRVGPIGLFDGRTGPQVMDGMQRALPCNCDCDHDTAARGICRLAATRGLAALFTLAAPAREQFLLGQMYALLLLLHTIGWRAYARKQDALAGAALGLALALKLSGWPIGLLFIARRRWTAVWTSSSHSARGGRSHITLGRLRCMAGLLVQCSTAGTAPPFCHADGLPRHGRLLAALAALRCTPEPASAHSMLPYWQPC